MLKQEIAGLVISFKTMDELKEQVRAALPEVRSKLVVATREVKKLKKQEKGLQKFLGEALGEQENTSVRRPVSV